MINKLYTTANRNINTQSINYKYTNEGVGFNYMEDMFILTGHSQFAIYYIIPDINMTWRQIYEITYKNVLISEMLLKKIPTCSKTLILSLK